MAKKVMEPGLVDVGRVGRIIALCLIGVWILWVVITWPDSKSITKVEVQKKQTSAQLYPITETIEITKEWSTTIPIYEGGPRKDFSYLIRRDDIAYEVEYNDGASKGGWIDPLPARNDRDADWAAPVHEGKLLNARFRISKNSRAKEAWLTYTIDLKKGK